MKKYMRTITYWLQFKGIYVVKVAFGKRISFSY